MSTPETLLLSLACAVIGSASAVLGLGGGLFLVPLLLLVLELPPQEAVPLSLVCTIVTSAAGSIALDRAGLADLKVVIGLELPAALGSILGAKVLAEVLPPGVVIVVFALLVGYAAWRMLGKARKLQRAHADADPASAAASQGVSDYTPVRWPAGALGCGLAGAASGLLGIGGGPIKVPIQTEVMSVPLKVALANSNLMVGITAAVGASVYYAQGALRVELLAPCTLGIAAGAYVGGRIAPRLDPRPLTWAFSGILGLLAARLLWKAIELAG